MKVSRYMTRATPGEININLAERWGSLICGIFMMGSAIRGRSVGKMKLMAGTEMIRCGITEDDTASEPTPCRTFKVWEW